MANREVLGEEYGTMRMQKKGTKLSQGGSDSSVRSEG